MKEKRIEEIDIAKGICILLMVVGHSGVPREVINFICAFHMPFFFFVSGITTNTDKPFLKFLKGKSEGLIAPFIIYYIVYLFCYGYFFDYGFLGQLKFDFQFRIRNALWFIPILFFAQMINRMIPRNRIIEVFSILVLIAISSWMCLENITLPLSLSALGFASSFVLLGRFFGVEGTKYIISNSHNIINSTVVVAIAAIIVFYISFRYQRLEINYNRIEPCAIKTVGALIGIIMIMMISGVCSRWKVVGIFLSYTGVNTFVFIGLSQIILKFVNLYIPDFVILKYTVVFTLIYTIIYVKNKIPFAKRLRL